MFRASDIFGRKAGATPSKPLVAAKDAPGGGAQKRQFLGPHTSVWDPATGQYIEEDLPAEVKAMMGIAPKKMKYEAYPEEAWAARPTKALGPSSVGLSAAKGEARKRVVSAADVDTSAPSIELLRRQVGAQSRLGISHRSRTFHEVQRMEGGVRAGLEKSERHMHAAGGEGQGRLQHGSC